MYKPANSDYYNEWIELYNPTSFSIDVDNWTIDDGNEQDIVMGDKDHGNGSTILYPQKYAIITDHGTHLYEYFNISEKTLKLYVDDSAICGYGLNNDKEKLLLNDSSGRIVDSVEWGYDYLDVPGIPAKTVNKGNSLARYYNIDTNNSIIDFYFGITPTPGGKNIVDITIDICPEYIPKVQHGKEYSVPFAIKIYLNNLNTNESYQLKSYVIGNLLSIWPASQTWNGLAWKYSNNYSTNIKTNKVGSWSGWQYVRFNKIYQEYKNHIENNSKAYILVKIKNETLSYFVGKKILLLDLDDSTVNGSKGGFVIGQAQKNQKFLENTTIFIENKRGFITGLYKTEDNAIDDNLVKKPGYFKIPSPVGSGYILKFCDGNKSISLASNIYIEQGYYGVKLQSTHTRYLVKRNWSLNIPFKVKNVGDFKDVIHIRSNYCTDMWKGTLYENNLSLNSGEMSFITLDIPLKRKKIFRHGNISIFSTSHTDIGESDNITISIEILGPELIITNLTCYDENHQLKDRFGEGETVTIKARIKNIGNENATNANITFYYDSIDNFHIIGKKYYDSIGTYQKYPSIKWDTTNIKEGIHTIFIVIDKDNTIEEFDESNNIYSKDIEILNTNLVTKSNQVIITELYYHTHSRMSNEFIVIHNPTTSKINITGWYLTTSPCKNVYDQTKIIFPQNTLLHPQKTIYLTQNASTFQKEMGRLPDFEYSRNANHRVPHMVTQKTLILSNSGGVVALKDRYNHTVDIIIYGETEDIYEGWDGSSVNKSGQGVILKRTINTNGEPVDSNTSNDWEHPRIYGIGQSDFPYVRLSVQGTLIPFFSPDCSYSTLVHELQNATESIYLNIYEFTNPFLGNELIKALQRNVSVFIFLEGSPIGGIDEREIYILNSIINNGGRVRFIVNDNENNVYARYIFNHGKYLVIDNDTIIVESCNWVKTGIPINPTFGNREWGLIVRNKTLAQYFLQVFLDDWNPSRCDSYSFQNMNLSISKDFFIDETVYTGSYKPIFTPKKVIDNFTAIPVFSPDTSQQAICDLIEIANKSIYIQQLYIYRDWGDCISPLVKRLINKSNQGVDIRIILNYNPHYEATNDKCNLTKTYLEEHGIQVKFLYTNWSYFTNLHNKGMIVDNTSVLISSINWNENSITRNREAGIIIEHEDLAMYYAEVFFYDWKIDKPLKATTNFRLTDYKNPILILFIYGFTFAFIALDWRKRTWI
jgi:phosphatidylserine/phosphatidylglycerophosphate/cardiolipin synthase-like enzyme